MSSIRNLALLFMASFTLLAATVSTRASDPITQSNETALEARAKIRQVYKFEFLPRNITHSIVYHLDRGKSHSQAESIVGSEYAYDLIKRDKILSNGEVDLFTALTAQGCKVEHFVKEPGSHRRIDHYLHTVLVVQSLNSRINRKFNPTIHECKFLKDVEDLEVDPTHNTFPQFFFEWSEPEEKNSYKKYNGVSLFDEEGVLGKPSHDSLTFRFINKKTHACITLPNNENNQAIKADLKWLESKLLHYRNFDRTVSILYPNGIFKLYDIINNDQTNVIVKPPRYHS